MRWAGDNIIVIPLEKTALQIVTAILRLVLSLYLLGIVIYVSILLGRNDSDYISIGLTVLAVIGLIVSVKDLLLPDKIILNNNFLYIFSAPLLFRRYNVNNIRKVSVAEFNDISFMEIIGYQCDVKKILCIIQTRHQKHFVNLKNTDDFQKITSWFERSDGVAMD